MMILLVGCGRMGGALLKGWLADAALTRIDVIEPTLTNPFVSNPRVHFHTDAAAWAAQGVAPDIVVLAVKPQVMADAARDLAPLLPDAVSVLSIAAGITLTNLTNLWGARRPAVRAMPNTPGAVGAGITAYIKNEFINKEQLDISIYLLSALGLVIAVDQEDQMDAVTALSGSGPAYVFHFIEAMETAGCDLGLPPAVARDLARQTVIGSAALLAAEPDQSPAALRQAVTSPNGTTEAALRILMGADGLIPVLKKTLAAAFLRSKELAQR